MTQTTTTRRPRKMAREATSPTATVKATTATAAVGGDTSTSLASTGPAKPPRQTKARLIEDLLARGGGATLAELGEASGWLPHTCRAFLTGLRKKGKVLEKDKRGDGATTYQLRASEVAA